MQNGSLKRVGDVFLATGGIVAGICFLSLPITSLTNYPAVHFISIQSFILHSTMVYVGILINKTNYIEYDYSDIKYYFGLICFTGIIAYIVNLKLGTNLMFISQNYPNTPIEFFYKITGKFFPLVMLIPQATLPFYLITYINNRRKEKCLV